MTKGILTTCAVLLTVPAFADIAQPKVTKYTSLWRESRMTIPPPPPEPPEVENKLENFALLSVSPLGDDYMVTMRDVKDPKGGKVRIIPGSTNEGGFKVLAVEQDPNDYLKTRVKVSVGGQEGFVTYDEKELVIKQPAAKKQPAKKAPAKPTAKKPAPNTQNQGQGARPPIPGMKTNQNTGTQRAPRVRRVPTPPTR